MANYSNPDNFGGQDFRAVSANPASPAGMKQQADDWAAAGPNARYAPGGWAGNAQSWFTGRNTQDTTNGWDTDFLRRSFAQKNRYEEAAFSSGDGSRFFDWMNPEKNKEATGVALWDDDTVKVKGREGKGLKRGDVFDNGVWQANVYETMDTNDADLMLSAFLFDGKQQQRLGQDFGPAVKRRLDENTAKAANARAAKEYRDEVDKTQGDLQDSEASTLMWIAAGAGGGAATGAGIGASIGGLLTAWAGPGAAAGAGIGGAIGGVVGTFIGGLGAFLNRDQLTEVQARGLVETRMAGEKWDGAREGFQYQKVGATIFSQAINPLQNLTQGLYDAASGGGTGDGKAAYYEVDLDTGRVGAPGWMKAINFGATAIDSIGQFSNPASRAVYLGSMGVRSAADVGMMGTTDHVFNPTTGQWDDIDGPKERLGAWGNTFIDVAQIGIAHGLGKSASQARAWAAGGTNPERRFGGDFIERGVDRAYAAIAKKPEILQDGVTSATINGVKYYRLNGATLAARPTLQALVPSEFVKWVPTTWKARQLAAMNNGAAVSGDDLYRAGMQMIRGGGAFSRAVMNGYAEASEEFVQAFLEPMGYGQKAEWGEAYQAALMGFAGGFGMGLGSINAMPSRSEALAAQARVNHMLRTGNLEMSDAEWDEYRKTLSKEELKALAISDPAEAMATRQALEGMAALHKMNVEANSPLGLLVQGETNVTKFEKALKNSQPSRDGAYTLIGHPGGVKVAPDGSFEEFEFKTHHGAASAATVKELLLRNWKGIRDQEQDAKRRRDEAQLLTPALTAARDDLQAQVRVARSTNALSPQALADLEAELKSAEQDLLDNTDLVRRMQEMMDDLDGASGKAQIVITDILEEYEKMQNATTWPLALMHMTEINRLLEKAWTGKWTNKATGEDWPDAEARHIRRAVEVVSSRHPVMDKGSGSIFLPQISESMTRLNQHGAIGTYQGALKPLQADHDGDMRVTLYLAWLPQSEKETLRAGLQFLNEQTRPKTREVDGKKVPVLDANGVQVTETIDEVIIDPLDDEALFIDLLSGRTRPLTAEENGYIAAAWARFSARVLDEFTHTDPKKSLLPRKEIEKLLSRFALEMAGGNAKARTHLLEGVANLPGARSAFRKYGNEKNRVALLELTQMVTLMYSEAQTQIAQQLYWTSGWEKSPADTAATTAAINALRAVAPKNAATLGVQAGLETGLTDATRQGQQLYYLPYLQAATEQRSAEGMDDNRFRELAEMYRQLASGEVETALAKIIGHERVEQRVLFWLTQVAEAADRADRANNIPISMNIPQRMMVLAQSAVPEMNMGENGEIVRTNGTVTLLQSLLRRSLQIEQSTVAGASDEAAKTSKINRLMRMTYPQKKNSYSASEAFMEIFGNYRMIDLLGEDSNAFMNTTLTLNAVRKTLQGMHEVEREAEMDKWKRWGGLYISKKGRPDPPYGKEDWDKGRINNYTAIVDAITATGRVHFKQLKEKDGNIHTDVVQGFDAFITLRAKWREEYGDEVRTRLGLAKGAVLTDEMIVDDMLKSPDIVRKVALLLPEDARHITVQVDENGVVWTAPWVKQMLLATSSEKAAVMLFVHSRLDLWNAYGAEASRDENGQVRVDKNGNPDVSLNGIRLSQIKSRYLQTLYQLAQRDDGGMALSLFIRKSMEADTLADLFDYINGDATMRGNRERLLPWFDDVADFEVSPSSMWIDGVPANLQRENLRSWGEGMGVVGSSALAHRIEQVTERALVQKALALQEVMERSGYQDAVRAQRDWDAQSDAEKAAAIAAGNTRPPDPVFPTGTDRTSDEARVLALVVKAIQNARMIGDVVGDNARHSFGMAVMEGLIVAHNKGGADERTKGLGEMLATSYGFGLEQGGPKQTAALTVYHVSQIRTNVTALTQGPVLIQFDDGTVTRTDYSDPKFVLEQLLDPRTNALAKTILGLTSRDLDANNNLQFYQRTEAASPGSLLPMLEEATLGHLYTEDKPSVHQAHGIIGVVEGFARTMTAQGTDDEKRQGFFPVQNTVNKLMVAFSQHPAFRQKDLETTYNEILQLVSQFILDLGRVDQAQIPEIRRLLVQTMTEKYDKSGILSSTASPETRTVFAAELFNLMQQRLDRDLVRLSDEIDAALDAGDDARAAALGIEYDDVADQLANLTLENAIDLSRRKHYSPAAALEFFEIPHGASKARRIMAKRLVISYLKEGYRYLAFQDQKDVMMVVERISNLDLSQDDLLDSTDLIPKKMWDVIEGMAAATLISERDGRGGSQVTRLPIDKSDPTSWQFYDRSYAGILDDLFSPPVIQAARYIVDSAKADIAGSSSAIASSITYEKVLERLGNGLLHEDRISAWTDRVPIENMKLRRALEGASVGMAIPVAGDDPKKLSAMVDAGWVTWEKLPEDQHISVTTISGKTGEDIYNILQTAGPQNPLGNVALLKLSNHFVRAVKIRSTDGKLPYSQGQDYVDGMKSCTYSYGIHPTVESSDFKVLDLGMLQAFIERLEQSHGNADFQIEIEYVDVDKNPYNTDSAYTNSVYFDGVGRNAQGSTDSSPVAALFFSAGAWSKEGQQEPLDFAARGGAAFQAFVALARQRVEALEAGAASVSGMMHAKAMRMWFTEFETKKSIGDINAFYKWMKLRHMVIHTDASGVERKYMPEEIIAMEAAGTAPPYSELKVVPLSDKVANTLYGSAAVGQSTIPGAAVQEPRFNLEGASPRPKLDPVRLQRLGLANIGQVVEAKTTELARIILPPKAPAIAPDKRGAAIKQAYQTQIEVWNKTLLQSYTDRTKASRQGVENFNIQKQRDENKDLRSRIIENEQLRYVLWRMGVPYMDQGGELGKMRTESVIAQTEALYASETSLPWVYKHGLSAKLERGVLTQVNFDEHFAYKGAGYPAHGDIVYVELSSILTSVGGDHQRAFDRAKEIISRLSDRGINVVLFSENGDQSQLQGLLSQWIKEGSTNLDPLLEGSTSLFKIRDLNTHANKNLEAILSKNTEIQLVKPAGATLILHTQAFTGLNESATFIDPSKHPLAGRDQLLKVPTQPMVKDNTSRSMFAFGKVGPGTNVDTTRAETTKLLLDLLSTPEGERYLLKLMQGDKDKPDPENVSFYKERGHGTYEPGIRSAKAALVQLRNTLNSGRWPGDPSDPTKKGTFEMQGDIHIYTTSTGEILLLRLGFNLPNPEQVEQQFKMKPKGRPESAPPLRIAASKPEVDPAWTLPPGPFVIQDSPSPDYLHVQYDMGVTPKHIWQGFKAHGTELPQPWAWPDQSFGSRAGPRNTFTLTEVVAHKGMVSKGAVEGTANNFRDMFSIVGWDGRKYLLNWLLGTPGKTWTPAELDQEWAARRPLFDALSSIDTGLSASQIQELLDGGVVSRMVNEAVTDPVLRKMFPLTDMAGYFNVPDDSTSPAAIEQRISMCILATLMVPGYTVDHIIATPGFATVPDSGANVDIARLPTILTDALESPSYPNVRLHLINEANSKSPQIQDVDPVTNAVISKPIYRWTPQMKMRVIMYFNGKPIEVEGIGQVAKWGIADENNLAAMHNTTNKTWQTPTQHVVHTLNETFRAQVARNPEPVIDKKTGKPYPVGEAPPKIDTSRIATFTGDDTAQEAWDLLTAVAHKDPSRLNWDVLYPAEHEHLRLGFEKVGQYKQLISKKGKEWDSMRGQIDQVVDQILNRLSLSEQNTPSIRDEIDYLVRQFLGRPGPGKKQKDYKEIIDPGLYLQTVSLILKNVEAYKNPLHGGAVPMPHKVFWAMLYEANKNVADPWAPRILEKGDKTVRVARGWDEWVLSIVNQVLDSNVEFHSMFQVDIDGFWNSYQSTSPIFDGMPLSSSQMVAARLMDAGTMERQRSIDPLLNHTLGHPGVLEAHQATYMALTGHDKVIDPFYARAADASQLKTQLDRQKAWLEGKNLDKQKKQTMRDLAKEGAQYIESSKRANKLMRNVVNISVTTRLAYPPLWTSALIEVPIRNLQEHVTDLVVGGGVSKVANARARVLEKTTSALKIEYDPAFSLEESHMLEALAKQMGKSPKFLAMLYQEITYQIVHGSPDGAGKVTKGLEAAAAAVARATSDPAWGMTGVSVAKRYLTAVWNELHLTDSNMSVQEFVYNMSRDPTWLQQQYTSKKGDSKFNPHRAGMNRVAQVRSQRQTWAGKSIMAPLDSMCGADGTTTQVLGHLLKIPFMFTRFNINALMTMTGLNGFDQVAAMFFDGRNKPKFMSKYEGDTFDLSDVIETMDLQRTFIRSGSSMAMIMTLGIMAGGLLGGDDKEERRRRLARHFDIVDVLDPREPHNKFQYADAIFLDRIPILGGLFKREDGTNAVVPHWILRQFISPVLGMARFFENGDFREVWHGFFDAYTAIPNSVMRIWNEADLTSRMMLDQANKEFAKNTDEGLLAGAGLIISIVSLYEKAIFENQFINSIYVAADKYDRDPYVIPMTAEENTGELDRTQGENLPQETDALISYRDPKTGEIKQGYAGRSGMEARGVAYAENNLTYALFRSLFSGDGFDSTYLRFNMAPKQRTIEIPDSSQAEVEALVLSAYRATGGQPMLSLDEIRRMLKKRDEDAGVWWDQDDIEKEAQGIFESQGDGIAGLSAATPEGQRVMTTAAADSIFTSLAYGRLQLGDPAIQGFSASQEMRDQIAAVWQERIIAEGIERGLSAESAVYRYKRIWFGDDSMPEVPGLKYILYDKRIPAENDVTYNQLNNTYVMGPDGRPWATAFTKQTWLGALGIPILQRHRPAGPGLKYDSSGNLVDEVTGINTGLVGIERIPYETEIEVPKDEPEIAAAKDTADNYTKGNPWFSRRYGGFSGGGYSSGGGGYFQRMQPFPGGTGARIDGLPMINTSSPIIRRANVNRERVTSERGRLKQWQ